jgi:hypothetical protein
VDARPATWNLEEEKRNGEVIIDFQVFFLVKPHNKSAVTLGDSQNFPYIMEEFEKPFQMTFIHREKNRRVEAKMNKNYYR